MAKNYGFLICILVMVMDIVAGILGIQAETAQNKEKPMKVWIFECRYPSHQAFQLGLAAVILLSLAHIIANLLGGCVWSKDQYRSATANRQLAVAFLIFSWIVLAVAFSMLIIGTLANSRSRKSCGILNHSHEKGRKEAIRKPRRPRHKTIIIGISSKCCSVSSYYKAKL
ncbi:putative transmembrane protein [Trifolium repens]|nr:putative transmembrane protein [Trifolium repens]